MDFWLGDSHLFPDNHSEWATESIFTAAFLGLDTSRPLPEAGVPVSPARLVQFGLAALIIIVSFLTPH